MLQVGKIKIRDIKELQGEDVMLLKNAVTPLRKRKNPRPASTSQKLKEQECASKAVIDADTAVTTALTKTIRKKVSKSSLKETQSNQKRIDSYFTSCPKTYDIKYPKDETPTTFGKFKAKSSAVKCKGVSSAKTVRKNTKSARRPKTRRKRLFTESTEPSTENLSVSSYMKSTKKQPIDCITINSDSEEESNTDTVKDVSTSDVISQLKQSSSLSNSKSSHQCTSATTSSSLSFGQKMSNTSNEINLYSAESTTDSRSFSRRKAKPCPPYKIIESTKFAVDAFQFGYIENVTHYFLTHFHADHYIGLTKSFAMPLYMSPITARLVRKFIPVQEQYINELELNQPCVIDGMEVTALDANHCPGAILIVFKFLDSGKCILHTGDFRACHEMESEPIFWNNHINTIYLDTTYISDKYAFCTQYESIMKAQDLIEKFLDKHAGKRILYICGSYLVGKEKFWSSLAEKYEMKVWAEGNRYKALTAINEERFNRLLVNDPHDANMHVIPMGKVSYLELVEYFKEYEQLYDMIFAIRPSGWEKDTKPRYGAKINVVGIEYSEHSSYAEMQRFVKFLKPEKVISTVPRGKDLKNTARVPINWYKYDTLKAFSNYQPTIHNFLCKTPHEKSSIRLPNINKGGVEYFVSPLKLTAPKEITFNSLQDTVISLISSKADKSSEMIEGCNEINKRECLAQNSSVNLQNNKNIIARTEKNRTTTSTINSSDDFEKSDFIIQTRSKRNMTEKSRKDNLAQAKPECTKKQLKPKRSIIKVDAVNSEELFETLEVKPKKKNNIQIENKVASNKITKANKKTANSNNLQSPSEEELKDNFKSDIQTPVNDNLKEKNSITQRRINPKRSQKQATTSNNTETDQHDKNINLNTQLNYTTSQRNQSPTKLTMESTSNDELQANHDTIKQENLEIPISQKRMTRSKSASTKTTTASNNSENTIEKKFKSKLLKLAEKNFKKTINTKLKTISTTNFNVSQDNPILKSTTDSSVDPTSADELQMQFLKPKDNRLHSPTSNEDCLHQFEYPRKSVRNKRNALNNSLTSLKKIKPNIDTQIILNTILEQSEDVDRFNCSQLAGLVVETVNKHNPDYSRDHIPAELLSDADDDWM